MLILVVDVECTCWENQVNKDDSEIIEIGICELNCITGEINNKYSFFVKPYNSKVSEFCTKLTGIEQKDVDCGISLKEACNLLMQKYNSKIIPWASYGAYDFNMFKKNCKANNIEYPFQQSYINVKALVPLYCGLNCEITLYFALKLFGIKMTGRRHRGIIDSEVTAKLLYKIVSGFHKSIVGRVRVFVAKKYLNIISKM